MSTQKIDPKVLRKKAEEYLEKIKTDRNLSSESELNFELSVHQIELEMQNDELQNTLEKLEILNEKLEISNEKYTILYEFAPAGYLTLSTEGDILHLNHMASKMLGKERSRLLLARFGFFLTDESKLIYNKFFEILYSTKLEQSCEVEIISSNNIHTWAMLNGIITGDGKECNLSMVDISELKSHEKSVKLNKELKQLLQLNSDKDLFISILAHDLTSPFSVLLGYSELLLEAIKNKDNTEIERIATIVNNNAQSTYALLEDLLKWVKVRKGKLSFYPQNSNIKMVTQQLIKSLEQTALAKNITLINKIPDEIEAFADNNMLKAILRNLVSNSIKFTNNGGAIIISAKQSMSNTIISVNDNGIGIEFKLLKGLFDFSNAKNPGLGLQLCREFVELHGGRIWVDSVIGHGSTFYFELPKLHEPALIENQLKSGRIGDLKILIVDDDSSLLMFLADRIKTYSNEILYADSGINAIEIYKNNQDIDLILMDKLMPNMNGYEAAKKIRDINKDVVIIIQTTDESSNNAAESRDAEINGFLFKPYNKTYLDQFFLIHFKKDNNFPTHA